MGELISCAAERWTPGIGDPTLWGWFTVVAYLGTALACAAAARVQTDRRSFRFWVVLTAGLSALAVNKQLDLQSALTSVARCLALADGWYDDRRTMQVAFIGVVASLCAAIALIAAWALRRDLRRLWPALLGCAVLLGFVAIRAASFHKVDLLIGQSAFGITANALFEIGGILLICWGAARAAGHTAGGAR